MSCRVGIDLGGTKISGVVLGEDGREIARLRRTSPRDYALALDAITALVADLEDTAGVARRGARVGIGTPGTWQPRLERMKNCNSTWLNDRPLLHDLEQRLGPRVRIANDADCLTLSESFDGAGKGAALVFGVILGTGVGGGLAVRGRLLEGPNGLAGEWGHVPLPYFRCPVFADPGPAEARRFQVESRLGDRHCYCGRVNCSESFLSGPGLAATHTELWGETMTAEAIAGGRDRASTETFDLYQHMLARSLAQVVNLVDPAVIVLGGGVSNVAELYAVQETLISTFAFTSTGSAGVRGSGQVAVCVRRARWGDDSGVRGAARLWDEGRDTAD